MFRRCANSKRVIALFGIVLALLPSVQHSHLLCHLGGCATSSLEAACSEHVHPEAKTCSHSHACTTTQETSPSSPQGSGKDDQDRSCPCPPDCWCHQAPQPLELPKCPSEPIERLLQDITLCDATTVADISPYQTMSCEATSAIAASSESVVQRCAELCRFLI